MYVKNLKQAGVCKYEVTVSDQRIVLFADDGATLEVPGSAEELVCANTFVEDDLKGALLGTQTGLSDYRTFLAEIADAGVHSYVADLQGMVITYYGKDRKDRYEEVIPEA